MMADNPRTMDEPSSPPILCEREGCNEPMLWHIGLTALCRRHLRGDQ